MATYKFNFIEEKALSHPQAQVAFSVSIMSAGLLRLPDDYLRAYELEGKSVRMYCDLQKKSIGWSVLGTTDLDTLKDARIIKRNPSNNQVVISIARILNHLDYKNVYLKNLPVQIYKSAMHQGDIHYVILPPKVVESEDEKKSPEEEKQEPTPTPQA